MKKQYLGILLTLFTSTVFAQGPDLVKYVTRYRVLILHSS